MSDNTKFETPQKDVPKGPGYSEFDYGNAAPKGAPTNDKNIESPCCD